MGTFATSPPAPFTFRPARLVIATAWVLASCGGAGGPGGAVSPAAPSAGYTSGEAHVEITGALEATLDLTLSSGRTSSFESGSLSLAWEDARGNFVSLAATPKGGEAADLLVNMSIKGHSASSSATDTCSATFEDLSPENVVGSFECRKVLVPSAGEFNASIDAEGIFSASR